MSTDDAGSPAASPEETKAESPTPKQGSTLRIVLILLLVLLIAALVIDRQSQAGAQDLYDSLDRMKDTGLSQNKMPSLESVHKEIGRTPNEAYDHPEIGNTKVEEYHFRGGLPWRKYIVYVYYRADREELDNVTLNQPLGADML